MTEVISIKWTKRVGQPTTPLHRRLTVLLLAICVGKLTHAQTPSRDPLVDFDRYIQVALSDWKTPGLSVAIVRGDEVLLTKGYGVREVGTRESVDVDTIFPISSVSNRPCPSES